MALVACLLTISACGGGTQQDAAETTATYTVAVKADFAHRQALAANQTFKLHVLNRSSTTIPDVTATMDGFYNRSTQPGEQDPQQPVWILNQGPINGVTALTNTWELGPLAPGKVRTFTWRVTPMQGGKHVLHYRVDASLYGKSKAVLASGTAAAGTVRVHISPRASTTGVDPKTGAVTVTGKVPPLQ